MWLTYIFGGRSFDPISLSQPGGADYANHITTPPPDRPTALQEYILATDFRKIQIVRRLRDL